MLYPIRAIILHDNVPNFIILVPELLAYQDGLIVTVCFAGNIGVREQVAF